MCGRYYEQPRSFNYGTYYSDNREFTILIQKIFYKIQNIPTGKEAFQIDDINDFLIVIKCVIKNCLKRANKPKLTSLTTAKTKFSHRRQNFFLSLRSELNKLYKFLEKQTKHPSQEEKASPSNFGLFRLDLDDSVSF